MASCAEFCAELVKCMHTFHCTVFKYVIPSVGLTVLFFFLEYLTVLFSRVRCGVK